MTLGSSGAEVLGRGQTPGTKNVVDYGAIPDGRKLSTSAIQRAIDDVFQAGGGTVYFPAGTFLTGRIDLRSGVDLNLAAGCTLRGSTSIGDYHGGEGSADASQKHLIYARDAEGITIEGEGTIDGQGPSFWERSDRKPLAQEDQWADVASHAYEEKRGGRPSPMIRFANCRKVRVSNVHLVNSAGWTLHLLNCDDVQVTGMSIKNPVYGPNTDGIDITGCQNVKVSGCTIATGDDAICLKSENPLGPEPRLVKNVAVTNCTLTTCCNGFKLGTSSEGGFEDISFTNSVIHNDPVSLGERVISGVALEVIDGGWIDGVTVSGIQMQRTRTPVFIRLGNRKRVHNYSQHGLRNVSIDNVQATESILASSITGLSGDEVRDVTLSNMRIDNVLPSRPEWVGSDVPEKENAYPEARMFGMLPVSGLYVRHARGIHLDRIAIRTTQGEARPTVMFDDVDGASITALASTPVSGKQPIVMLSNARNVSISESAAPAGTGTFVGVSGSKSEGITLSGDDLRGTREAVAQGRDVSPQAVTLSGNTTR
jgi:polygalacturonase